MTNILNINVAIIIINPQSLSELKEDHSAKSPQKLGKIRNDYGIRSQRKCIIMKVQYQDYKILIKY